MEFAWVGGFVIVFVIIGVLEVFDRTSFALIALASRSHPFRTWVGGASAFVLTTSISVTVGSALADVLGPGRIVQFANPGAGIRDVPEEHRAAG